MSVQLKDVHQGIISLAIRDIASLHAAYMPYIKNGGLFIPTSKSYKLGDEIFMVLALPESADKLPVSGRVVWITPPAAQGNRATGVGVQINVADKGVTRGRIETMLAAHLKSDRQTHTM
ncbi:MAG: PilZ domain-containing protein [Gammaproteobacteria bacterium]